MSSQKGFIAPLLLALITLLLAGGVYGYLQKKQASQPTIATSTPQTSGSNIESTTIPHIDSIIPSTITLGSFITINGKNFEWVPSANCQTIGCSARAHTFAYLTNSSGQRAILAEDGVFQNRQIYVAVASSLCTRSQKNGLPCEPIAITPGTYSLSVTVDGIGTSNSIPVTITN